MNGLEDCDELPLSVPDTQELRDTQENCTQPTQPPLVEPTWGNLNPMLPDRSISYSLSKSEYKVGRLPVMDIMLDLTNTRLKYQPLMSKHQFTISKGEVNDVTAVFLEDFSLNGTFVNGELVGAGNKIILGDGDAIAVAKCTHNIFKLQTTGIYEQCLLPSELSKKYVVIRELGSGASGIVKLVLCRTTFQAFAIKIIKKNVSETENQLILKEVVILRELKHPFIIKMINIVERPNHLFIILEFMKGGELFSRIRGTDGLKNDVAKFIFYQIAKAMEYLHDKGVTHRDLKPENILLSSDDEFPLVKISDFGLSKLTDSQTYLKTVCGTPLYAAPELFEAAYGTSYTKQVDIWGLGLVLYIILTGCHPFSAKNDKIALRDQILKAAVPYRRENFQNVPKDAISLLKRMLLVDPYQRLTIQQVLESSWLNDPELKLKVEQLSSSESNDQNYNESGYLSGEPRPKKPCL